MNKLYILLTALTVLNISKVWSQCDEPLTFYTQTALDNYFSANSGCTSLGTVEIYSVPNGDPITNVNALQSILSIYQLTISSMELNLDLSGLSNLNSLTNLTTYGAIDHSFCSSLINIDYLWIEFVANSFVPDPGLEGFNNLQSSQQILLKLIAENGSFINIFPSLTQLSTLLINNISVQTLDGFHNVESLDSFVVQSHTYMWSCSLLNILQNTQAIDQLTLLFCIAPTPNNTIEIGGTSIDELTVSNYELSGSITFPNLHSVGSYVNDGWVEIETNMPELNTAIDFRTNQYTYVPELDSVYNSLVIAESGLSDLEFLNSLDYIGGELQISDNLWLSDCSAEVVCQKINLSPEQVIIYNNAGDCIDFATAQLTCNIPVLEPSISGKVYADINCNGIFDENDIPIPNPLVLDNNSIPLGISNSLGSYVIQDLPVGILNLAPQQSPAFSSASPFQVNTDTLSVPLNNIDFALCPVPNYSDVGATHLQDIPIRPGFEFSFSLITQNLSATAETFTITINHSIFDSLSNWQSNYPFIISGNQVVFEPIVLLPLALVEIELNAQASASLVLGTAYTCNSSIAISNTDQNATNNTTSFNGIIVGSYDPNDIIVNKPLIDVEQADANGDWLTYRIRFQNTGNFPAEFVNVVSEQDELVDMSTIQMIDVSHSNSWSFNGREVSWFFDNIQLPDSTTDLEGSQGYIIYKVRTMQGLGVGDVLEVNAAIYFDFNEPVITNTATTEYYLCPEPLVLATNATAICEYDIASLSASNGYDTYTWSFNDQTLSTQQNLNYAAIAPGSYTITCAAVATPAVCQSTASIYMEVIAVPQTPIITQDGNTLMASGTGTFVWSLDGVELNNTINTLEITQTGNYSVFIDGDCPSEAAAGNYTHIGIEDLNQEKIILFPNPAENFITLQHVHYPSEVSIIDMTGRTCLSILNNNPNQTIDLDNLSSGTYRMQVKNPHGVWSLLFIKE